MLKKKESKKVGRINPAFFFVCIRLGSFVFVGWIPLPAIVTDAVTQIEDKLVQHGRRDWGQKTRVNVNAK